MSRLLVLVPVLLWFIWADASAVVERHPPEETRVIPIGVDPGPERGIEEAAGGRVWFDAERGQLVISEPAARPIEPPVRAAYVAIFLGGLGLVVVTVALTAVRASREDPTRRQRRLLLYRAARSAALPLLLGWYIVALFWLGWGEAVERVLGLLPSTVFSLALPGSVLATTPVYLAWGMLFLVEYPVVRQRREGRLLSDLDRGRPVYATPPAGRYAALAVRTRLLFALVPLVLVLALRDAAVLGMRFLEMPLTAAAETIIVVISVLLVVTISPELLRRLLPTSPLPPGPIRDQLEEMCRRTGLGVRDILVWHTDGTIVNAAVVGFLPRLRYVLLSDMMLESMPARQVEAVFAHEIGHVKHKHLLWYVVFLAGVTLLLAGPIDATWSALHGTGAAGAVTAPFAELIPPVALAWLLPMAFVAGILLLFGLLSRNFERQADVFGARTMQALLVPGAQGVRQTPVGPEGAEAFNAALRLAASMNQLPLQPAPPARGWRERINPLAGAARAAEQFSHFFHGTILSRIRYLERLAERPALTARFDAQAAAIKWLLALIATGSLIFIALT